MENRFSVSEFVAVCNQTLDYAYADVVIEGEVMSYKENQGKWVFFDLKDEECSVNCFMPLWNLRMPLEDGMKVVVKATPKLTNWGKFSLTVKQIMPVGEGSLKKSYEMLKKKLEKEGLFATAKKRPIPTPLDSIGVISSTGAAGYADFIKILNERWGGLTIKVAHTGVQGLSAADQIIRALKYFNEVGGVQIIAIIRGGGSADDLAVFNDEELVRTIAASRIPVITGIGHEVDESLSDLAADIRASTPSNAAQMLTKDRKAEIAHLHTRIKDVKSQIFARIAEITDPTAEIARIRSKIFTQINDYSISNLNRISETHRHIFLHLNTAISDNLKTLKLLDHLNPDRVLRQGYAIVTGNFSPGQEIDITTRDKLVKANVTKVTERN